MLGLGLGLVLTGKLNVFNGEIKYPPVCYHVSAYMYSPGTQHVVFLIEISRRTIFRAGCLVGETVD